MEKDAELGGAVNALRMLITAKGMAPAEVAEALEGIAEEWRLAGIDAEAGQ